MSDSPNQTKKKIFVAPVFNKPLKDLSAVQGECLVLECRVKGVPPPKVVWQREGHVIDDCQDFRMLHRGEISTLVIGEAFPEDTGIFTCEATNKVGTARTSCKVTIQGSGYNSISTKAAATSAQSFQQSRPTQVLPTTQHSDSVYTLSTASSTHHQIKSETHVSHLTLTPKNPRTSDNKTRNSDETSHNSSAASSLPINAQPLVHHSAEVTSSPSVQTHSSGQVENNHSHLISSSSDSFSSSSSSSSTTSRQVTMATTAYGIQPLHNADENHNFKAEKDQVIQEVANAVSSPPAQNQGRQKKMSREMALIERDIELRHSMTVDSPTSPSQLEAQDGKIQGDYILYSPTLAAILEIEPQEYKISTFEQRLMNEIEYRLERTPPVNEDPEDAIFEEVPVHQQSAPSFSGKLKNFKAMDGTSTKFLCRVSGKPKAKVYWFKDGKQISKRSQHYLHKSDGEGSHELHIPHLCMEDDGNYTALAINPQGKVSSTGRLAMISERNANSDVRSPTNLVSKQSSTSSRIMSPRSPSSSMTSPRVASPNATSPMPSRSGVFTLPDKGELAADEESPVEKYYRPTFVQRPAPDTHSEEGKLVRFDVKVTGLPKPDLEWLINGRPVRQDSLHQILVRENNVHSLLFQRVSPMDEGNYTITASNKAGSAVANVQLHVTPREHRTAPAFVHRLTGQCVAEGDPIRLEGRVVATPRPTISWKRGSDQVVPDGRIQLYEDDSGYVCLQITQTSLSDAAWYTCSATNKAGISSCNCKLDVYSRTAEVTTSRRRIKTPNRYANLAKVAGVDMREALSPEAQAQMLPESDEL